MQYSYSYIRNVKMRNLRIRLHISFVGVWCLEYLVSNVETI